MELIIVPEIPLHPGYQVKSGHLPGLHLTDSTNPRRLKPAPGAESAPISLTRMTAYFVDKVSGAMPIKQVPEPLSTRLALW